MPASVNITAPNRRTQSPSNPEDAPSVANRKPVIVNDPTSPAEPARLIDELQRRVALAEEAEIAGFDEQAGSESESAPDDNSNVGTDDTTSSPKPQADTEADPS